MAFKPFPIGLSRARQTIKFLALVASMLLPSSAFPQTYAFIGKAFDLDGQLAYIEEHLVTYRDDRVAESQTVYLDPEKRRIGQLFSDYSQGLQYGSYHFKDIRANYEDGVRVEDDHLVAYRKESSNAGMETRQVPKQKNQIVGQGFHHFIAQNLKELSEGRVFHIRLVLPSRLDQFDFRIRKRGIEGRTIFLRLEIDNWLLRLFAPYIDVEYELNTGQLLRYEGMSNLKNAAGEYEEVKIVYDYRHLQAQRLAPIQKGDVLS
jgi:hypothetical protein